MNKLKEIIRKTLYSTLLMGASVFLLGTNAPASSPTVGATFTLEGITYKVQDATSTVNVIAIDGTDWPNNTVTVPATVVITYGGSNNTSYVTDQSFKVVAIDTYDDTAETSKVTHVTHLTISEGITTISEQAFSFLDLKTNTSSTLKTVTLPNTITKIGEKAFSSCTQLTSIKLPLKITTIEPHTFYNCSLLESITIPSSVTSIGDGAFSECKVLTNITIPSSVTRIGDGAFSGCTTLTTINIPSSVTSIGTEAFARCAELTTITLPSSVTRIGDSAFYNCTSLKNVVIQSAQEVNIGTKVFKSCNTLSTITVYNQTLYNKLQADRTATFVFKEHWVTTESTAEPGSSTDAILALIDKSIVSSYENSAFYYGNTGVGITDEIIELLKNLKITYIPPAWVPTEPDDIYRFSLCGAQDPDYTVLSSTDSIRMVREVQGPLFFQAVAIVQGNYTLAKTYNIFVNDMLLYHNGGSAKIMLQIPEYLQQEGRTFRMFCVTQDGAIITLDDLDNEANTFTFETDRFYAFALAYLD